MQFVDLWREHVFGRFEIEALLNFHPERATAARCRP
jgi:hypothetical protein